MQKRRVNAGVKFLSLFIAIIMLVFTLTSCELLNDGMIEVPFYEQESVENLVVKMLDVGQGDGGDSSVQLVSVANLVLGLQPHQVALVGVVVLGGDGVAAEQNTQSGLQSCLLNISLEHGLDVDDHHLVGRVGACVVLQLLVGHGQNTVSDRCGGGAIDVVLVDGGVPLGQVGGVDGGGHDGAQALVNTDSGTGDDGVIDGIDFVCDHVDGMVNGIFSENFCIVGTGGNGLVQNPLTNISCDHGGLSFCVSVMWTYYHNWRNIATKY